MTSARTPVLLVALVFAMSVLSSPLAVAQVTAATGEAPRIAEGRRLLSQGDAARAAALGKALLAQFPNSAEVLEFAVDAEIAQSGASAGLLTYERWATANARENERALHQVVRAVLHDSAGGPSQPSALKVQALQALVADGDADAAAMLSSAALMQEAGPGLLAATGNDQAIRALIAELGNPMGNRRRAIMALGSSKSQQAVDPLVPLLQDPNPDIRAAAAEALGKLRATRAITALKVLLNDPVFPVQYQAAASLFGFNDMTGLSWLRQLETSSEPGIRLAAVQATRSQPDGSWLGVVRELTTVADPEVRRQAAELLAPHDPKAARDVLKPLLAHPNVAVQEMATSSYIQTAETDLPILRAYLRAANPEARVYAAIRLLELTH